MLMASCKKNVHSEASVYSNDFENGDLTGIANGLIGKFNGSAVLGQYNKGNFILSLKNLPKHDLITVTFDLYIHDSWDGNKSAPDGPDIWQMIVDGSPYINTTFSNAPCLPGNLCSPQSYPDNYPNNYNNPRAASYRTDLPGVCVEKAAPNGTTQYKITKTFKHTGSTLTLKCLDKLVQSNTADQKCDESWSVDNIDIKAITL